MKSLFKHITAKHKGNMHLPKKNIFSKKRAMSHKMSGGISPSEEEVENMMSSTKTKKKKKSIFSKNEEME